MPLSDFSSALTATETATRLGRSRTYVNNLVRDRLLSYVVAPASGDWYFDAAEVEAFALKLDALRAAHSALDVRTKAS